jgi:intracellular septation protein
MILHKPLLARPLKVLTMTHDDKNDPSHHDIKAEEAAPLQPSPDTEEDDWRHSPLLKLVLEAGPLLLFFIANMRLGLIPATSILIVSVLLSLALSYALTRHIPLLPIVTAGAVIIFGGLTIYFNDTLFIKIKPTILNALFGLTLLGGLVFDKPLLPLVFDTVIDIDDEGWRILSFRWGLFFIFLAVLNEVIWRTQTEDFWVSFKVFGTMPLSIIFAFLQLPLIMEHSTSDEDHGDHW